MVICPKSVRCNTLKNNSSRNNNKNTFMMFQYVQCPRKGKIFVQQRQSMKRRGVRMWIQKLMTTTMENTWIVLSHSSGSGVTPINQTVPVTNQAISKMM